LHAKLDEMLTILRELREHPGKKRGRPRDAYADAFSEVRDAVPVTALEEAFHEVRETLPLSELLVFDDYASKVMQAFTKRLPVAHEAASKWHYENQRKVLRDPARAQQNAERRRKK
jgi:hypothetical protein